ncbi:glycosyltransferase [Photobacterium leiognathi]|uniref:glycosyltransferase n=1 Tax=Photobacterium leiognathi TaxID=553611 RepID=UPI003DA135AD
MSNNNIECIYLKQEKNLGVATANNIGIKKAKELEIDCILLSNYDISIDDNLLIEKMYNEYKNGECVITCHLYITTQISIGMQEVNLIH